MQSTSNFRRSTFNVQRSKKEMGTDLQYHRVGMSEREQWWARWCWVKKHLSRPWNYYAYFRKVIDVPGRAQRAVIRVSADARYVLYVNGKRVHQGPARSWAQFQSYDTIDIAPLLVAGKNSICAIVHQFGAPTFFSVYRDASGFLLDGMVEVDGRRIELHTPKGWMCREAKGWKKDVTRLTIQMGFAEHFDAGEDPADWMSADFVEGEDWHEPRAIGPVGCHPWLNMEARGVPLLGQFEQKFVAVTGQFVGENARGYKVAEDVYHLPLAEERKRERAVVENAEGMLRGEGQPTTVTPPEEGHFAMVNLDLGQTRTGHIMLDITEATGDEIIDIIYTEQVDKNGGPVLIPLDSGSSCEEATADRYRCRAGAQRWEAFHYKGFRYATLVFRNVTRPLVIRQVGLRQVHAALEDVGAFECSDASLNEIWRIGRETQRNCMFDAYVDCPWREQAQWWGDARVQFRVNAYSFGDVSLFERGIRQVARSQASDGSLHAHPPSDAPNHRLPDFMLTWVASLWDYYFHTERSELLKECLPAMRGVMEFFARHEAPSGLIGGFEGFWVFLDWQSLYKSDFSAVLNMMYLQGLRYASAIAEVAGEEESAGKYLATAMRVQSAVEKHFWDAKGKVWRDGFDPKSGEMVEEVSQHANCLAMLLRLKPETHPNLAKDVLLKSANSRRGKILAASPFFYAYVLEALAEANYREEAIRIIREKWGEMIEQGATTFWEVWEPTFQSRCHAWSASPVYHLSQQVLGVMPVEVGWKRVRIAPWMGKLDFARGRVPTPLGVIKVEWERVGDDQMAVRV
ncbi:MAG TPA: alpha-L-rhamnosidase C-terminal domain-containing protein, partial [Tepidisphaeraceae bacterium]|nr:alpha-L-rhamnosidase C-terminal domain-containing protein [Tepidisphaeraceae bacterium]